MPKLWYTVEEAAQELGCIADDVLHQIQICHIYPSFCFVDVMCRVLELPPIFSEIQPISSPSMRFNVVITPSVLEKLKTSPEQSVTDLVSPIPIVCEEDCRLRFLSVGKQWEGNFKNTLFMRGAPSLPGRDSLNEYASHDIIMPTGPTLKNISDLLITAKELELFRRYCKDHYTELETEPSRADGIVFDIPSQTELARMCGVTNRTIPNWEAKGLFSEVHGREKWYSRIATAEWLKQTGKHKELESFNNSK